MTFCSSGGGGSSGGSRCDSGSHDGHIVVVVGIIRLLVVSCVYDERFMIILSGRTWW